mgnify:FL=1
MLRTLSLSLLLAASAGLVLCAEAAPAASGSAATAKQKARAENQKANVEKQLSDMQKRLSEREAASEAANDELRKADQAISDANRRLRSLKGEREKVEARLAELRSDSRTVGRDLSGAEKLLEDIVRAQYIHSQRHSWQSLIEGGNPNELSRTAAELRYLSIAQVRAADALEKEQSRIETVSEETRARRTELQRIAREEESNRRELLSEKRDRQEAVKKLKRDIETQQAAIDKLKKDQTRLENLVADIDKRLERERAPEEAARQREAARQAKASAKPVEPLASGNFAKLKGRLTKPVSGRIAATFGSRRTGTALWQGLLFRAPEGAEVSACASGRVVFSDWLRGYGNLIIIDHGNTYMSVYANNESILKNVGDRVKAGETVATVGTSGASDEPGLYFEIRYKGKPINPQPWLAK